MQLTTVYQHYCKPLHLPRQGICRVQAAVAGPSMSRPPAAADGPSCSYALAPTRRPHQCRNLTGVARAGTMDVMPAWTLDQIAGLVFGGVMVAAVLSYRQVDRWVARRQRQQLGLCAECGGLYDAPTCTQKACPLKQQAAAAAAASQPPQQGPQQ